MKYLPILSTSVATLGLISSTVFAMPDFGPVDMGDFYAALPAVKQDAKLGTLVKAVKISTSLEGAQAWKIAYVSSDIGNHKTLVTGILVAPKNPIASASRPIMAWAHGTTGTAQTCGPSQVLNPAQSLNQYYSVTGNSWTDFGLPAIKQFIKAGYVVVATDYQGLGGGGKHQYAVSVTQAQDVINSVRAAAELKEAGAGNKAILYGWSQGGGAVITAASLNDYVNVKGTAHDGITILGVVALAPFDVAVTMPSEIHTDEEAANFQQKLSADFSSNVFNFTHYAQTIWGMTAAFPELKLNDIFTETGAKMLNGIFERKCMHVTADTINYVLGADYKNLLSNDAKNAMAWIAAYKKASVPPVKPYAPVIIYWGNKDTVVPPVMGQLYYEQMCKMGGNMTRVELPGHQTHFSTPESAEPFYVKWAKDRFAGLPATNGCQQ